MAPEIKLEDFVWLKTNRHGKSYFYFRHVFYIFDLQTHKKIRQEKLIPLPHPFDEGYRSAYREAWKTIFGVYPDSHKPGNGFSVCDLCDRHQKTGMTGLSDSSRYWRIRSLDYLRNNIGKFQAFEIKPLHMQALYDKLSGKPQTANRFFDDFSKIFQWGISRGFSDINPASAVERITSGDSYDPWPNAAIEKFIAGAQWHLCRAFLLALYTGQRRDDILTMRFQDIQEDVWTVKQGKTGTIVPVPLHPIAVSIVSDEWEWGKAAGIIDRSRTVLRNSRGKPWGTGFGASWRKELIRLNLRPEKMVNLRDGEPRLTFHGLRTTNATIIASEVAKHPDKYGGIDRVQSLLGHHSRRMSEHYARHAKTEHMNNDSVLLIPDFGNPNRKIGNP